jgi:hypothetical protein
MSISDFRTIALELAVSSVGHSFPRLSRLVEPSKEKIVSTRLKAATTGYSIAILDITLTPQGEIRLIEANGSNGGLTSVVFGNEETRAKHMALAFESKPKPRKPFVALLAFKPGFAHVSEFFARASTFAQVISRNYETRLCLIDEDLGSEDVAIICGAITEIANQIQRKGRSLFIKGRQVVFACNPNLLPELTRRSIISHNKGRYDIDTSFFHENELVALIHDKAAQQNIAEGAGINPLFHAEAWNFNECLAVIKDFHSKGRVAVGKMNAGSGGAGIEFFPPSLSNHAIHLKLNSLIQSAEKEYGRGISATIFPIRFFEFARSTNFILNGKPHLWDIRMQCLIYPRFIEVTPCLIRICPAPFDEESYAQDAVVSNLTGRKPSLEFVRSAQSKAALKAAGIKPADLQRMMKACARWCESAWKWKPD